MSLPKKLCFFYINIKGSDNPRKAVRYKKGAVIVAGQKFKLFAIPIGFCIIVKGQKSILRTRAEEEEDFEKVGTNFIIIFRKDLLCLMRLCIIYWYGIHGYE